MVVLYIYIFNGPRICKLPFAYLVFAIVVTCLLFIWNSEIICANQEIEPGVEHYLRGGRALAAYNTLIGSRAHVLGAQLEGSGKSSQLLESSNLLDSLTENEEALIASVCELLGDLYTFDCFLFYFILECISFFWVAASHVLRCAQTRVFLCILMWQACRHSSPSTGSWPTNLRMH